MSTFADTQNSTTEALMTTLAVANEAASVSFDAVTTDDPTLTAAQTINAVVTVSGQTTAQAVTTATAAAIVAALPNCIVGSAFDLVIRNEHTSSGAVTLTAGAGVTLDGTVAIPITKTQIFKGLVTDIETPAVTIYGLLTVAI